MPALSLDHLRIASTSRPSPDEEHIVADDGHGRHRLTLYGAADGQPLALALPVDAAMPIRLAAAARLAGAVAATSYQPTSLQRSRLTLMLRILDAGTAGLAKRQIAEALVYPHMRSLRGAAWKASAERRRVHRLCEEAARLRDTGVPDLLHARLHPAG